PKRTEVEENDELLETKKIAHNIVECRRKHKIARSIATLSSLVCPCDCGKETRADVLQRAVNKIEELEKSNKELRDAIEGKSTDNLHQSESYLQSKLAIALVDHLSLLISINQQEEDYVSTTADTHLASSPEEDGTQVIPSSKHMYGVTSSSNETRLGSFTVENLLESTTTNYDRSNCLSHDMTSLATSSSMMTRDNISMGIVPVTDCIGSPLINGIGAPPTSSWFPYASPSRHQYQPVIDSDWAHPPNQVHCRFETPEEPGYYHTEPCRTQSLIPSSPQSVWRPYNDLTINPQLGSAPLPPPTTANGYNQTPSTQLPNSSSFLVGQLLENILQ
uniref:BHLH domain-containing protein n=2 Tax=Amphimedon queenslandica TaxID=400682 RepID=A0A1X7SXD9_AMPQE